MSGEDQERFEDYLELEKFIEDLQAGHSAHPSKDLTPVQARIYQMGALFHSASPGAGEMRPGFAEELQGQLEQEWQQKTKKRRFPLLGRERTQRPHSTVSRRSLLTGTAAVAASLAIGAGIEKVVEQTVSTAPSDSASNSFVAQLPALVPANAPSTWQFVTTLDDLSKGAIRFRTDTVIGYVVRYTGEDKSYTTTENQEPASDNVIAMSAACTHMGCIVQWEKSDQQFHCPCHGGVFAADGTGTAKPNTINYLLPLPRFDTKVEDNKVYVRVPVNP
jgi:Rieske Fe-S protein